MLPAWSNGVAIGGKIPCSFIFGCNSKIAPGHTGNFSDMFSLEIDCDPEDRDLLIAELWEQGSAGIAELNALTVRSFFEDTASRSALLAMFPGARLREEEV